MRMKLRLISILIVISLGCCSSNDNNRIPDSLEIESTSTQYGGDVSSSKKVDWGDVISIGPRDSATGTDDRDGLKDQDGTLDVSDHIIDAGDSGAMESGLDAAVSDHTIDAGDSSAMESGLDAVDKSNNPDSGLEGGISPPDSSEDCCEHGEPSIACGDDLVCTGGVACVVHYAGWNQVDSFSCGFPDSRVPQYCTTAEDCEDGYTCNTTYKYCELTCNDSRDCPLGMVCMTNINVCMFPDLPNYVSYLCDDAADCPEDQFCCDRLSKGTTAQTGGRCLENCLANGYSIQLCSTDAECTSGTCTRSSSYWYSYCH